MAVAQDPTTLPPSYMYHGNLPKHTLLSQVQKSKKKNTGSVLAISTNALPVPGIVFDLFRLPQLREDHQARREIISAQLQSFTTLQINMLRNKVSIVILAPSTTDSEWQGISKAHVLTRPQSEILDHLLWKIRTEIPHSVLLSGTG